MPSLFCKKPSVLTAELGVISESMSLIVDVCISFPLLIQLYEYEYEKSEISGLVIVVTSASVFFSRILL